MHWGLFFVALWVTAVNCAPQAAAVCSAPPYNQFLPLSNYPSARQYCTSKNHLPTACAAGGGKTVTVRGGAVTVTSTVSISTIVQTVGTSTATSVLGTTTALNTVATVTSSTAVATSTAYNVIATSTVNTYIATNVIPSTVATVTVTTITGRLLYYLYLGCEKREHRANTRIGTDVATIIAGTVTKYIPTATITSKPDSLNMLYSIIFFIL